MAIHLIRKDGTTSVFKNSEYITAYFFIPKEMLDNCPKELRDIPRSYAEIMTSWEAIETIESDLFMYLIMEAYAFMAWKYMEPNVPNEAYALHEPAYVYAHNPSYWVETLIDEKIMPSTDSWVKECRSNHKSAVSQIGYVPILFVSYYMQDIVPKAMERFGMNEVIKAAKENRAFEDFDPRSSRTKSDFYRKCITPELSIHRFHLRNLRRNTERSTMDRILNWKLRRLRLMLKLSILFS